MREKEESFSPPLVGGSSLLVIYAVLCLTVLAALCLSTALADGRLSEQSAASAISYYDADTRAEEILSRLRGGEVPEGVTEKDGTYSYAVPVSDTLELQAAVRVDGETCEILKWQTVSTADWQPDTAMHVWDGAS